MMPPIVQISDEIRTIYRQEGDTGYVNIEAYLEKLLGIFPGPERLEILQIGQLQDVYIDQLKKKFVMILDHL